MKVMTAVVAGAWVLIAIVACSETSDTILTATFPDTTPSAVGTTPPWTPDGVITSGEYSDTNTYGGYEISWSNDSEHIYLGIRAKTSGWVAVAFWPEQRMKNADMVQGLVASGVAEIVDMFSTGDYGPHPADVDQGGTDDILASGGAEVDGYTTIEFKRALNTGDSRDKPLALGTNPILWAYGSGDSITQKHATRGSGEIRLK